MDKIEVAALTCDVHPAGMMGFLGAITQKGQTIENMNDLYALYVKENELDTAAKHFRMADLPHGTIKRFTPITLAIVGASRRFLAQARTNQVGFNYVSASLQYGDYRNKSKFVVPYEILASDNEAMLEIYKDSCEAGISDYESLMNDYGVCGDTAAYVMPQSLRNILIMQGNHQAWDYFIRSRTCNRNTAETQYVALLIWEALLNTPDGDVFFGRSGPDCLFGQCREGKMTCGDPLNSFQTVPKIPRRIIEERFPKL